VSQNGKQLIISSNFKLETRNSKLPLISLCKGFSLDSKASHPALVGSSFSPLLHRDFSPMPEKRKISSFFRLQKGQQAKSKALKSR
jgi:hypothetical protein